MKPLVLSKGSIPVVCLHGFLGAPEDWRPLAEALGSDFGVLALPLPGHGAPAVRDFDEAVSRVVEFLRTRPPAHLVGYSMGGRLALAAALRLSRHAASAIRSLTIISATPGIVSDVARAARARDDDRLADKLERQGLERFVRDWYAQPLFASLADRPALLRELITRRAQGDAAARAGALRALTVGRQPSFWDDLPRLEIPTQWIAGDRDAKYFAIAARAAALCLHGRALTVCGVGHLPHMERVSFTTERIRAFFQEEK